MITSTSSAMESLKSRLKATWMSGDFTLIARSYEGGAADFIARLDLDSGTRVLDVACGTGNLAIPAARAGAVVTGADIAPNLLEQAALSARVEGLTIRFDEADAEQLPYDDSSFDVVVSMFGVMFAPRPDRVAAELTRVCRRGGRIALANWVPDGFVGRMFRTIGAYVPPPSIMPSPMQWGIEETVRERLGGAISDIRFTRRPISFKFPFGPAEVVDFWRLYYGPTHRAFEALEAEPRKQAALGRDLEELWLENNRATDGSTHVVAEYLEVLATRA